MESGIISQLHRNSFWEWQIDETIVKRSIENKEKLLLRSPPFRCLNENLWNLKMIVLVREELIHFIINACLNSENIDLSQTNVTGSHAYIVFQKHVNALACNSLNSNINDENCIFLCGCTIHQKDIKIISSKGLITVRFLIGTIEHYKENSLTLYSESSIETLYNKPDLSDVQLKVENVKFYAHKAILANFSPVFAAMFRNDMKEAKENVVEISDVSAEVVDNLLKFIYSGKANINESTMYDLSYASEKYQINNLKSLCANYLYDSLTIENCVDIACLAEKCRMDQLKYKVIIFIAHNYNLHFMNSKPFIELEQSNLKLFLEITKNCMRSNYQNKLC